MSQSLDVKIAERIKSRLLDRDALIKFFESIYHHDPFYDDDDNNIDFFTYYTTHYGTEIDDNAHDFIEEFRFDLCDELSNNNEKNEYYRIEDLYEISVVDTIKLFKAVIALIDEENDDEFNYYVSVYTENDWATLADFYANTMVSKLITDYRHQIYEIVKTYINDKQEALRAKKINEMAKHLAIEKIKRNQLFNCGLGLKLSMRDCGIELST